MLFYYLSNKIHTNVLMKITTNKFEDYLSDCKKTNIHKELIPINSLIYSINDETINKEKLSNVHKSKKNINSFNNFIYYGPSGSGKYTQMLNMISHYSPSKLKYERKLDFLHNKKQYIFKLSDIHIEIDMELLGCHAKSLFNELYYHIIDIFSTRNTDINIIVCKNFHSIHSELLDIFYSYMQSLVHKKFNLVYILLTEQVSFIPDNILDRCQIIPVKTPKKKILENAMEIQCKNNNIINLKFLKLDTNIKGFYQKICNKIINYIEDYDNINFLVLRDLIYDIHIYNLDPYECLYYIIHYFIKKKQIDKNNIEHILLKLYPFLKKYNNNYRPIFHLESFILNLTKTIHNL